MFISCSVSVSGMFDMVWFVLRLWVRLCCMMFDCLSRLRVCFDVLLLLVGYGFWVLFGRVWYWLLVLLMVLVLFCFVGLFVLGLLGLFGFLGGSGGWFVSSVDVGVLRVIVFSSVLMFRVFSFSSWWWLSIEWFSICVLVVRLRWVKLLLVWLWLWFVLGVRIR